MDKKTITCYFIGWNISETIHLTIDHYQKFCSRIVYLDNHSDDNSRQIAESMGAEVRLFGTPGVLNDKVYTDVVKNHVWKGDKADLVIVCDDDEILIPPAEWDPKATIYRTSGFAMIGNEVPRETFTEVMFGRPDPQYSKLVMFDPRAIQEIGYIYGCHQAKPIGNLIWGPTLPLFHYKDIGGVERQIKRHALYEERRQRSPFNMQWGCGKEYGDSPESKRLWFEKELKRSGPFTWDGVPLSPAVLPSLPVIA